MLVPRIIEFTEIGNPSLGFISVAENNVNIPFEIKRAYWAYFTPNYVKRGGHAHKNLEQIVFSVSGKLEIKTECLNGIKNSYNLNKPNFGLYLPRLVWRDITFSHSAVLLCLASELYNSEDYIREYTDFQKMKHDPSIS